MFKRLNYLILILFCFILSSPVLLKAQDVTKVDPAHYKIVLDNEKVRVIDHSNIPGEKTGMHSHPDYLIYVFEGGKSKATSPDGKTKTTVFKKGETLWLDATTHTTENIGKTKIHMLLIELKK